MREYTNIELVTELKNRLEYDEGQLQLALESSVSETMELRDRIRKAIEYIEQYKLHSRLRTQDSLSLQERELLDILKGSDKNGNT